MLVAVVPLALVAIPARISVIYTLRESCSRIDFFLSTIYTIMGLWWLRRRRPSSVSPSRAGRRGFCRLEVKDRSGRLSRPRSDRMVRPDALHVSACASAAVLGLGL